MKNLFDKSNLKYVFHVAVLGGLIFVGTKYLNGDDMWRALRRFNWKYAPFILLLTIAYLLVKGWRFAALLREVQSVSRRVVLRGYMAAQAATLLPGGVAARAGILEQSGIPIESSAAAVAHSSLSDQIVLLLCAAVAAFWFDQARKPVLVLIGVLFLISMLLGLQATRIWLIGVIERILHKVHLLARWQKFVESMREMTTPKALISGLINATIACALMVEALHLCTKGVGAAVSYPTLLLAFALPSLMGRISALPGGVGVTEAGMIGVLNAAPNVTREQAAAAVVVFRLGTLLFGALIGALVYFFAWNGEKENADKPVDDEPTGQTHNE